MSGPAHASTICSTPPKCHDWLKDSELHALATPRPACHGRVSLPGRYIMDGPMDIENSVATGTKAVSSVYVPPLQLTAGQPPPIAANGGLSYMAFDRDGDAGTAAAMAAALRQIVEGEEQ